MCAASPHRKQRDQRERHRDEAEIKPGAGAAGVVRHLKELVQQPGADAEAQDEPHQIGRRVVGRPDRLALRQADAQR